MATMNISLPDQMKAFVEAQSADGKYANSSDFIRDLIRREQIKREKVAAMRELVVQGLASPATDLDPKPFISTLKQQHLK